MKGKGGGITEVKIREEVVEGGERRASSGRQRRGEGKEKRKVKRGQVAVLEGKWARKSNENLVLICKGDEEGEREKGEGVFLVSENVS